MENLSESKLADEIALLKQQKKKTSDKMSESNLELSKEKMKVKTFENPCLS